MPRGNGGIIGPVNTSFSGVWSLTEAQLRRSANTWPNFYAALLSESAVGSDVFFGVDAVDPYFKYTTLLLPGNGTNGAQNNTFLDSSTNNFTITRNGNTTQGTFSPFSQTGWGNFATATSASVGFSCTTAPLVGQTASTFTAECWIYMTEAPVSGDGIPSLIGMDASYASSIYLGFGPNASRVLVLRWFDGASKTVTGSTTLALNTWYHVAVVANSNALAMYVNGNLETLSGTTTLTNRNGTTATFSLLLNSSGSNYQFRGYVSNIRVCTSAVYTTSFTPSTLPLTTTSQGATNCQLLTAQDNRFIDKSSNGYLLVAQGSPSVVAFSPFNPTVPWSAALSGGSGYFDGSGDYLSVAHNTAFNLGSNDWCIEFFLYKLNNTTATLITKRPNNGVAAYPNIYANTSNQIGIELGGTTFTTASSITLNSWNHVAIVRNGSGSANVKCYINGVADANTGTLSSAITSNTNALVLAGDTNGNQMTGYMSNFRMVNGSPVYTSNFTPPTAPLTAITNTSLLLNFTNAGIYDATSKNDLETVGDAQISNTTAKWGSTSIKFDGTGDYLLSQASNDLYAFGSGDFTIELWLRLNNVSGQKNIYDPNPTSTVGLYPNIYILNTTLYYFTNGSNRITAGTALSADTWYHIAVARSGTSTKLFLNGTQEGSTYTDSNVYINGGVGRPVIGGSGYTLGSNTLNGYIQDLRITKGYARYTANFTPPTAAFPKD